MGPEPGGARDNADARAAWWKRRLTLGADAHMRALSSAWGFPGGDLQPPCGPGGARSRGVLGGLPPYMKP